MDFSDALFTESGPVAYFTLNRPTAGNAMTWAMYDALVAACDRVDGEGDVRVFVIRAAGGVFSTGTDISQFKAFTSGQDGLEYERRLEACLARLERVAVPTIAQVEGVAAGAGFAIALACDMRVCSPAARFGVPIARTLGNGLSIENCARLVEHVGPAFAKDLLFTGRFCDAAEAKAIGFINRLADTGDVERAVDEVAATIARNAPLTIRGMKAAMRELSTHRRPGSHGIDALVAACYASHDFRAAVAAFLEKRPPTFTGH